jgi:outer membrane protein
MKPLKYYFIFFAFYNCLYAQENLTVTDAIKMGLEKNYSVLIAKNNSEIIKAQNNIGNAGLSPTISLNSALNASSLNSYQEFNSGAIQERAGAKTNNLNATINANWTIFDGLKMFAVKKRLSLNEDLSTIQLKQQMETTVYDIIVSYYDIVKIKSLIKAAKQNLIICEERKKLAKIKFEIGSDSKVDLMLAQSDENKAKSAIIQLELQLLNSKIALNNLISLPANTNFITIDSIVINYSPSIDDLKKELPLKNSSILISKQNELIFKQSIIEAKAAILPFLQINSAYNFTRNESEAGIIFLNRQNGFNAGLTAGWLLFNGNKNNRLVKERTILALNQRFITEQTQLKVDGMVYVNYESFLLNKKLSELEFQNLKDAKELLNISLERYKIGKANFLETIETQKNLEETQTRYINALYSVKIAETELLKVNGSLIK